MRRVAASSLVVLSLAACSPDSGTRPSGPPPSGFVVVTAGGLALTDGQNDVPPTLDLGLAGDGVTTDSVAARLDGSPLKLVAGGDGLHAKVAAMAYASGHSLEVDISGRPTETIRFQVVDRTGVSAAGWLAPDGQVVVDVVFERPPAPAGVAAAVSSGQPAWLDPAHLRLHWAEPPGRLEIPAGGAAARGSVLDGPLRLSLDRLRPGQVRRATVPPAAPAQPRLPVTVWATGASGSHTSTKAHASQVAVLSPTGWVVAADGGLNGAPDGVTLNAAAAAGRPPWPLLANDFGDPAATSQLLGDPDARARLVAAVVTEVRRRHLGGIHLDFEAVSGDDRARLSSLVADLAAALHGAGARLAVDVVPHRPGTVNSASAAYDDPAIAASADQLVLLSYDQHTRPGDPGPVAGLDWQAQEVAGAAAGVAPAKVLLGLPLYARRWSGDAVSSPAYLDAIALALGEPGVAYDYDFAAATPLLRSMPGGVAAETWFDDADSLLRKIAAVSRFGLGGIAVWRAGQEDPAFWSVI